MMRSPLTARPLRNPGQSLDEELNDLQWDVILYVSVSTLLILYSLSEWLGLLVERPPQPILTTVLAIPVCAYSFVKIRERVKRTNRIKLGRDGERCVGQYLELLRSDGSLVFHDIPAHTFNIDHVVISKAGVFVIETKTYSKPNKGKSIITFDGATITLPGRKPTSKPVDQVISATRYLENIIKESTGKSVPFQPIVTFPGWFIDAKMNATDSDAWVLNTKGIPKFLSNSKKRLCAEDMHLVAYHLSRYVRTFEQNPTKS